MSIIFVAFPDWSASNDPEALELNFSQGLHSFVHVVKLLQTWLIETKFCQPRFHVDQIDIPRYSGQYRGNDLPWPRRFALS